MYLSSKILTEGGVLLLLLVLLASSESSGQSDIQPVFEEPPMDYIYGNLTCESFNQNGSFCAPYLTGLDADIIVNYSRVHNHGQSGYTAIANMLGGVLNQIAHQKCLDFIVPLLCRYVFVTCDPAYNTSVHQVYQPICRHGCDVVSLFACPMVWRLLQTQLANLEFGVLDAPLCDPLDNANGSDIPDCIDTTDGGDIPQFAITTDCFNGRGRGYSGNVSTTRSGKTCQHWNMQAPHQFILPFQQYPELGEHNYCRNPGSRGPDGPWCFTTDPDTRWEYCNVSKCDPTPSCELYQGTICYARGVIGKDYVFVNSSNDGDQVTDQVFWENALHSFDTAVMNTVEAEGAPQSCVNEILSLMCFNTFPACDYGHPDSRPRQVCRSYCDTIRTGPCREVWDSLLLLGRLQTIGLPNCSALPEANGGEAPECFIPFNSTLTELPPVSAKTCYNEEDKGELYDGKVNITMLRKTCQAWDDVTPHFHPLTSLYRPYLEGHNYCRNPERRGEQPWCYTTDPDTRWEYCSIPVCVEASTSDDDDDVIDGDILTILAIVIPALILITLIIIAVTVMLHCKSKRHTSRKLAIANEYQDSGAVRQDVLRQSKFEMLEADDNLNPSYIKYADINITDYTDGVDLDLPKFPRKDIVYIGDLGQGNFGVVIQAEAKNIIAGEDSTTVAIKVLKEGASDQTKKDFFREAALMHEFNHPNILKLLGVCIEQEPFCMLFQYMEHGDLNSYLRKHNTRGTMSNIAQLSGNQVDLQGSLPIQLLVNMSINIAAGLEYLAQHHYIHRDLATRNCLIDSNFTVKIADFGLSQDIYATDYCRLGDSALLPIRWMPPEAIMYAKFTLHSDVWSFGVVLWEIFSYGAQPYYSLSNEEVVDHVRRGEVLKHPPGTPTEIYDLMVDCWATNPDDRPTASELHIGLRRWNPDMSASISDTLSSNNPKPYENMAAVKEMQRKKSNTLKEQHSTQKVREGSAGSSDGSQVASNSSSSPTSDGDVATPLNA